MNDEGPPLRDSTDAPEMRKACRMIEGTAIRSSPALSLQLGKIWRAPPEAQLPRTSFGISGGLWTLPIGQRLEVPPLEQMRVIINLSPLVRHEFWADGRQRRSAPSQVGAIRIAPMHEPAWAQVSGDAFRFAQIYIPPDALLAIDRPPMGIGTTTAFRDPHFDAGDQLVAELAGRLLILGADPEVALHRDHLALALLSHLDQRYGHRSPARAPTGALAGRRLRLALERLHAAEETPTLTELAGLVDLSPHHFARSFRAATGLPPHGYLRAIRMERAKRMLATGAASITDVALACGYSTPSAFATAFLRTTGLTPSAWRQRRAT